jgi:antitoxin component YwqK of YwqJK toxin-antitoxin module
MKKIQLKISILLYLVSLVAANAQEKINQLDSKGKKEGHWKGVHEKSKRLRYEGTFQNGVEAGTFKYYDDTKAQSLIATRVFSQNGTVAQTTFFDQKGNKVSEGKTINRLNEGVWNYYHKSSTQLMTVENYKNGKLEGSRKVYFLSGAVTEEATYRNGLRDGIYKVYLENGIVAEEINFKNGQYDGSAEFRDGSGKTVSRGNFVKDEKKGIWEFFEDGKLVKKEKYPLRVKFKKRTDIPKQ